MDDNKPKLDPSIESEIKRILAKDPNDLTANDKVFLRARKAYIGKDSRQKLADVFEGKIEEPEAPKSDPVDLRHPGVIEEEEKAKANTKVEEDDEDEDELEEEDER